MASSRFPKFSITKLEAAQRQLRTAIKLFFENGDQVSIHTLVSAAHGILRDIAVKSKSPGTSIDWNGIQLPVKGSVLKDMPAIRQESKAEYFKTINRAQNFFKHADKDSEDTLQFAPSQTEFLIFDCSFIYQQVRGIQLRELFVFNLWFVLEYPDSVTDAGSKLYVGISRSFGINSTDRKLFSLLLDQMPSIPEKYE